MEFGLGCESYVVVWTGQKKSAKDGTKETVGLCGLQFLAVCAILDPCLYCSVFVAFLNHAPTKGPLLHDFRGVGEGKELLAEKAGCKVKG